MLRPVALDEAFVNKLEGRYKYSNTEKKVVPRVITEPLCTRLPSKTHRRSFQYFFRPTSLRITISSKLPQAALLFVCSLRSVMSSLKICLRQISQSIFFLIVPGITGRSSLPSSILPPRSVTPSIITRPFYSKLLMERERFEYRSHK